MCAMLSGKIFNISDKNTFMTYGSYAFNPTGQIGPEPSEYPSEVIENNSFRTDYNFVGERARKPRGILYQKKTTFFLGYKKPEFLGEIPRENV